MLTLLRQRLGLDSNTPARREPGVHALIVAAARARRGPLAPLVEPLEPRMMLAAPVLVGSNHLNAVDENSLDNPGTRVAALVEGLITDPGGPATGIAVTSLDTTHGSWQFATTGGNWASFDTAQISDTHATLLSADVDTRVRFIPAKNYNGTVGVGLTFRAWDASDLLPEGTTNADASLNGGATPFSAESKSAGVIVTPVGVAPEFGLSSTVINVDEDAGLQDLTNFIANFTPGSENPQIPTLPGTSGAGSMGDGYPALINQSGLSVSVTDVAQIPNSVDPVSNESLPARLNYSFSAPGDPTRLFVNDMRGKLWVVTAGNPTPALVLDLKDPAFVGAAFDDVASLPGVRGPINSERGFSTFAFSPYFNDSSSLGYHKIYTVHTEFAGSAPADFGNPWPIPARDPHQDVLTEWELTGANLDQVDPLSRREILRLDQPRVDHNMNQIAFNPTPGAADIGLLYIGVGDGGNTANDAPAKPDEFGDAQNPAIPYGKILRIDPLGANSANHQYGIPNGAVDPNPFIGSDAASLATLDEVWALGLRNPQRFSWDPNTGKMYIADLGQKSAEEVNLGVAGANYGWGKREGMFVTSAGVAGGQGVTFYRPANDDSFAFTDPVATYDRSERGIAIVGGFVYRGSAIPYLTGKYVFGDLNNGKLFYVDVNDMVDGAQANIQQVTLVSNGAPHTLQEIIGVGPTGRADLRFGLGGDGEIYITTKADGKVRKLGAAVQPATHNPPAPLPSAPTVGPLANTTAAYHVTDDSVSGFFATAPSISPTGELTFEVNPNVSGTVHVTVTAQDFDDPTKDTDGTAHGRVDTSAPRTFTINVNPVNDAPVLDGAPTSLPTVAYNNPNSAGTLVSDLLNTHVVDIDAGALSGIAVTGVDNSQGQWESSLDGGANWAAIAGVGDASALLLPGDALVRFVPSVTHFTDVVDGLTYRAWDQTSGSVGGLADTSPNGDTTAFSTATSAASIHVSGPPPFLAAVYLRGSNWTNPFLAEIGSQGLGNSHGYAVPVGDGAQLAPLPWSNIDHLTLRFSDAVTVHQGDLVLRGVNTPAYSFIDFSAGLDGDGAYVATWTLGAPIGIDKLLLSLADSVVDGDNAALDGEWTNPTSIGQASPTSVFPSGDGLPGGAFTFRFNVAPGDTNQNGGINIVDVVQVRNRQGSSVANPTHYSLFGDINGDGGINVQDTILARNQQGKSLPAGEPALPASAMGLFRAATSALVVQAAPTTSAASESRPPAWPVPASGWTLKPVEHHADSGYASDADQAEDLVAKLRKASHRRLVKLASA
ncbi:MAG: PQQ-dependent sugar dehydrogenase [Planctomycetota bacterium]|nr:PQQ-dependent sugar dehydrogenase [Planctomycetota bacterium]